jgi:pimeloyl-ACP methyl ester carboxylesterase
MFTHIIEVEEFGGLNIHYVHQRSSVKGAIPLLFIHGCMSPFHPPILSSLIVCCAFSEGPGSFLEVTKILLLLTTASSDHPSFHVVAPSLPGYAWSEGVQKKGFHAEHYAKVYGHGSQASQHSTCALSLLYSTAL